MHPTDQISTGRLYYFYPSKISGALYHKVSISWVNVLIGIPKAFYIKLYTSNKFKKITLASPKSASLIFPALSISKF